MDVRHLGLSPDDLKALGYHVESTHQDVESTHRDVESSERPPEPAGHVRGASSPRTWVWTLAILTLSAWAASGPRRLPDPVAANAPVTSFSSARAMTQLVEIADRPHPPGSPEHDRVRAWLLERLRALGLESEVQVDVEAVEHDGILHAATVRNVVARLPGRASTGAVALVARYDTAPLSPGAGAAGVGVAAILETLRAVQAGEPLRNDLVVVLTDAGDHGLGARAFVERHPWMSDIELVLSVAMRGVSGSAVAYAVGPENGAVVRAMAQASPQAASTSLAGDILSPTTDGSSLAVFVGAGARGVGLGGVGGRAAHGQEIDLPVNVSERTLQHHGAQLLAMTRAFGAQDLSSSAGSASADRVYAPLPVLGVIHYPASRAPLVALGLTAAWALALLLVRLRGGSMRGVGLGVLFGGAAVAGAGAIGWAVFDRIDALHPEHASFDGAFYREGVHLVALACLSAAWVMATYALARRRHETTELFVGGLGAPLAAAAILALRAPSTAVALHWPLALAVLTALLLAAASPRRRTGRVAWILSLAVAAGVLFLAVPSLELLAGSLTLRAAPLLAAVTGMGLLLIIPALDLLLRPSAWWAPGLVSAVAVLLVVLALPTVQNPARHPLPTALVYLIHDSAGQDVPYGVVPSGRGVLGGFESGLASTRLSGVDGSTGRFVPERRVRGDWLVVPGLGEDWARSWVAEPRTDSTGPGVLLLAGAGGYDRYVVAGSGPASEVAGPVVRIVGNTVEGGRRYVRLEVRSLIGAEMLGIHVPEGEEGALAGVGGGAWANEPSAGSVVRRSLTHWGRPAGGSLLVDLRLNPDQTVVTLEVLEHHLRPREIMGEYFFRRADSLIADASAGSDRLIQRTPVRILVAGSAS